MTFRPATEADRPAVEATLWARVETALFPLSNLLSHGMSGGHPRAMRFWLAEGAAVGRTEEGMVFPQLAPALAGPAARALAGAPVRGIVGAREEVAALREALGLAGAEAELESDEALLTLPLADLVMPPLEGLALAPFSAGPREFLVAWRAAYGVETLGWAGDAEARAAREVAAHVEGGRHRVLLRDGTPVAQAGLNAVAGPVVQVGAVWTPPALRGQGLARAAVALVLAEARDAGASRAVLFTANPAAERAYRALGFRDAGRFALLLFREPQVPRRAGGSAGGTVADAVGAPGRA